MASERDRGMLPTIVDRLIDPDQAGGGSLLGYDLARMVAAVQRDLEDLLNTRQSHQGLPREFVELHQSVATYGLPDFSSVDTSRDGQVRSMARAIEEIIEQFEPRLRDVRAIPVEDPEVDRIQRVRFRIDARLRLEPHPEVGFETVVELLSGHTTVRPKDA